MYLVLNFFKSKYILTKINIRRLRNKISMDKNGMSIDRAMKHYQKERRNGYINIKLIFKPLEARRYIWLVSILYRICLRWSECILMKIDSLDMKYKNIRNFNSVENTSL